jgi:hypothetical protein
MPGIIAHAGAPVHLADRGSRMLSSWNSRQMLT